MEEAATHIQSFRGKKVRENLHIERSAMARLSEGLMQSAALKQSIDAIKVDQATEGLEAAATRS